MKVEHTPYCKIIYNFKNDSLLIRIKTMHLNIYENITLSYENTKCLIYVLLICVLLTSRIS